MEKYPERHTINRAWLTHAESKSTETCATSGDERMREPYPLPPDVPVTLHGMTDAQSATIQTRGSGNVVEYREVPASANRSIIEEADSIAGQDRSRDYGHPYDNHKRIADIWNVQMEKKLAVKLEARDVALMMIGLKLARLANSPNHRDSLVDIVGYVKCLDMIDQHGD